MITLNINIAGQVDVVDGMHHLLTLNDPSIAELPEQNVRDLETLLNVAYRAGEAARTRQISALLGVAK